MPAKAGPVPNVVQGGHPRIWSYLIKRQLDSGFVRNTPLNPPTPPWAKGGEGGFSSIRGCHARGMDNFAGMTRLFPITTQYPKGEGCAFLSFPSRLVFHDFFDITSIPFRQNHSPPPSPSPGSCGCRPSAKNPGNSYPGDPSR